MNRDEKHNLINNRILESILEQIKDKSFEKITADEIAESADISKRTLYKYFLSKDEMYLGLVEYCFSELNRLIEESLNMKKTDSAIIKIMSVGRIYLDFIMDNSGKGRIIEEYNQQGYEKDYSENIKRIGETANKYEISKLVKEYFISKNVSTDIDISTISIFLWANIKGLANLLSSKKGFLERYYKHDSNYLIEQNMLLIEKYLEEQGVQNDN
ncbi:MAG: TetR/AcrR family transcriptional regulator [Clostridiales bacterium]|nr:TetR/AcrR family transcriptional regulator [Clostridiales bacterium]